MAVNLSVKLLVDVALFDVDCVSDERGRILVQLMLSFDLSQLRFPEELGRRVPLLDLLTDNNIALIIRHHLLTQFKQALGVEVPGTELTVPPHELDGVDEATDRQVEVCCVSLRLVVETVELIDYTQLISLLDLGNSEVMEQGAAAFLD